MASNGQHFYYNAVTGVTQWEKPPDMSSEDQYHAEVQTQSVQQEKLQHPTPFSVSQQPVSEPNQSSWSDQSNAHALHTHVLGQIPYAGVPGNAFNYVEQVGAQSASQS